MADPFVAAASASGSSVASVPLPSGIQLRDAILIAAYDDQPTAFGDPDGFTLEATQQGAAASNLTVWSRVADGTEGSSVSFPPVSSGGGASILRPSVAIALVYRGLAAAADAAAVSLIAGRVTPRVPDAFSAQAPSVTPVWTPALVIAAWFWRTPGAVAAIPSGYTLRAQSSASDELLAIADCQMRTATATGVVTASSSFSEADDAGGAQLVFRLPANRLRMIV